jgi:hypothetical protein
VAFIAILTDVALLGEQLAVLTPTEAASAKSLVSRLVARAAALMKHFADERTVYANTLPTQIRNLILDGYGHAQRFGLGHIYEQNPDLEELTP